jgi:heptosyltransferase-2
LREYVYKKRSYRIIIRWIDSIGFLCKEVVSFLRKPSGGDEIKKVLVFKLDHIGDVFLATPAIKELRLKFPNARITVIVGSWAKEVLEGNPWVDELISYDAYWHNRTKDRKLNIKETIRLIKSLRKERYDIFFDMKGDILAILLGFLCGIRRRVGFGNAGGGFFLTDEVPIVPGRHQTEILLDAVRVMGDDIGDSRPEIFLSEKEKRFAEEFLQSQGVNSRNSLVGIHMGAGYPSKIWMPERFAELINRISKKGLKVLLVGGSEDLKNFESARPGILDSVINAIGKTTIKETAALINRCRLFIGNDSFPVHMAAAMGVPTVVIFSAVNDSLRWAPKGEQVKVIKSEVPCGDCEKWKCDVGKKCLQLITVEKVFEQVIEFNF